MKQPRDTIRPSAARLPVRLLAVALLVVLYGCASPGEQFDRVAARLGFQKVLVAGHQFAHAVYIGNECHGCRSLHVYLGGDGSPWINNQPSRQPTPRDPMALRLLAVDPAPSIFVGRPCYHELEQHARCDKTLWTSARYSEAVIDSMAFSIEAYRRRVEAASVLLVGYSGGGSIAVLIANRLDNVSAVVTVAGNLDIEAWARHHGYDPLTESLNPADLAPLPAGIRQLHYSGALDPVVPPITIDKFRKGQVHATFEIVQGFDHVCCWESVWPRLLSSFD